jgi:hypothetical protein
MWKGMNGAVVSDTGVKDQENSAFPDQQAHRFVGYISGPFPCPFRLNLQTISCSRYRGLHD